MDKGKFVLCREEGYEDMEWGLKFCVCVRGTLKNQ